jgi:rhomboid protease GluP
MEAGKSWPVIAASHPELLGRLTEASTFETKWRTPENITMNRRPGLCPSCRTLVGVKDSECHQCGAPLSGAGRMFARGRAGVREQLRGDSAGPPWWKVLLLVNVAMHVIGLVLTGGEGGSMLGASNAVLDQLGLQHTGLVLAGEWWRLLACTVLHANLMHLGFNMYFLIQLGPASERMFGNHGFLIIYILGGLGGSLVELALGRSVLGASGALLAVIGALAGLGIVQHRTWRNPLTQEMLKTLAFITVFGLVVGSVAHGAHIGGFITGAIVLFGVHSLVRSRQVGRLRTFAAVCALALVASLVMVALHADEHDPARGRQLGQLGACAVIALNGSVRPQPSEPRCLSGGAFDGLGADSLLDDLRGLYRQRREGVPALAVRMQWPGLLERHGSLLPGLTLEGR